MPRFFYSNPKVLQVGKTIVLTDDIYHHWCVVLRAKAGDVAILFDGQGGEYTVVLSSIHNKQACVLVWHYDPICRTLPYHVCLGLVVSRGERMDYAIQKATEMGVATIQLLTSERCQVHLKYDRDRKKIHHWQQVAIAACEQSGLNSVPVIYPPIGLEQFVRQDCGGIKLVLAVPSRAVGDDGACLFDFAYFAKHKANHYTLLVGAEGGLSDDELMLAYDNHFLAWQIGDRVLRTETAPLAALAYLQAWHDVLKAE